MGTIGILNVGAGDTKLTFDPTNPLEMIRAARIVRDMIRHGYALLIEVDQGEGKPKTYRRATDFDEATCEYIIADLDPVAAEQADKEEPYVQPPSPSSPRKPRTTQRRVSATATSGIAVARSAGG